MEHRYKYLLYLYKYISSNIRSKQIIYILQNDNDANHMEIMKKSFKLEFWKMKIL